jgi:hypothetical protein
LQRPRAISVFPGRCYTRSWPKIGKFCGNGPELWLGMQQAVDLWDARQKLTKEVAKIPTPKVAA